MKWFIFLMAAFVGAVCALGSVELPPCGQICISNMLGLTVDLGCPIVDGTPDASCLCSKSNFGYGIRDCANEACPPEHVGAVIAYGTSFCQAVAALSAADQSQDIPTPAALTALGAQPNVTAVSATPSESAINTDVVEIVSTFTSGDQTITATLMSPVTAVTTGASPGNDDSNGNSSSDVRGHNKDNSDVTTVTSSVDAGATGAGRDAAATTTTDPNDQKPSGAAGPVATAFANAPALIAVAAALVL